LIINFIVEISVKITILILSVISLRMPFSWLSYIKIILKVYSFNIFLCLLIRITLLLS
jgi:hypothetical protein